MWFQQKIENPSYKDYEMNMDYLEYKVTKIIQTDWKDEKMT